MIRSIFTGSCDRKNKTRGFKNRLIVSTACLLSTQLLQGAFQQDTGTDGIVSIEAENFDTNISRNSNDWVLRSDTSGFSGSGFMRAEPDNGSLTNSGYDTNSPELTYEVNFTQTGTHYVWIRGYVTGGNDDSCHVGIDGSTPSSADRISIFSSNSWDWSKQTMDNAVATINVTSTGVHTLNFWMREDGFRVDKIVLTTNSSYTPSGTGPSESSTSGGGGGGIDFSNTTISSYSGSQDAGTYTVLDNGDTLRLQGNAWKKIPLNYTVTADTEIIVDIRTNDAGELIGIALDEDNDHTNTPRALVLGGSQSIPNDMIDATSEYSVSSSYQTVTIPIGSYASGYTAQYLGFIGDDDGDASTDIYFRNVTVQEGSGTGGGQAPYGGTAQAIPGTIQAEDYDTGGAGVAFNDTTSGNSGNAYRSEDVDIQATSDSGGGYNVGWISNGEWLEYTVDVATSGSYDITARVASSSAGGNLHIEFDGTDVTGTLSFSATGGWQNWTDVTATGVNLTAGQQVMRIAFDSSSFNLNYVDIVASSGGSNQAPVVDAGNPQTVTMPNSGFINATVTDDGLPNNTLTYQWSQDSGPGTTTFNSPNSEDTAISFSTDGTYVLRLTADDGSLSDFDTVTITVNPQSSGGNNPVTDFYPGEYSWTDDINWGNQVSILDYGGSGNGSTDNLSAFNAARDAVSSSGGGVVYFPSGTYYFSDSIYLKDGVVLLGDVPTTTDAKNSNFDPPSNLVFPEYVPTFSGSGTPNITAFKKIYTTNPDTDSNIGLVWLDVNRAGIELVPSDTATSTNVNQLILGIRSNNVATPDPSVPSSLQNAWQRYSYRFSYNVKLHAFENAVVMNSRFNDNITDNYSYSSYLVDDRNGGVEDLTGGKVVFNYTNHYVISVGRSGGPFPNAATPATAPELFREGNVVRDNYVYNTMRVGIYAAGQGLQVLDNIRRDQQGKEWWTDPTGRRKAQNAQTLENRAIDVSGYDVVVDGNDYRVYRHLLNGGPYLSVDGEGILTQECCGGTLIRGIDITNNVGNAYIGLYKMRDIDDAQILNNELISYTGLGIYVVADTNGADYTITNSTVDGNDIGTNPINFIGNATGGSGNFITNNTGTGNINWACETNANISGNGSMNVQPCE